MIPAKTTPRLLDIVARVHPDLVIYEELNLGAAVAGAVASVPVVRHGVGPPLSLVHERMAATLREHWPVSTVAPPPGGKILGACYLDIYPPGLYRRAEAFPVFLVPLRPVPWSDPAMPTPAWVRTRRSRPRVYLTFGTVPFVALPILREAAQGLAVLDADVVVVIGPDSDPRALGPLPEHVRVERFVPQAAVLEHVDLAVHHGGSGTTLASLARGLPQLVLPQALPDQAVNAANVHAAGAGLMLSPDEVTADAVAERTRTLLADRCYAEQAGRIQREIAAMPSPADAVYLLQTLGGHSQ
jgi:UDP:flavonoid glycosyltransferase YjiC (YdhE family)